VDGLLPPEIERSGLDPAAPPGGVPDRRWWGHHLAEVRWQAELARLLADPIYRGVGIPHGDGTPVLLVPGFLAGDSSLLVMRRWLERIGYRPFDSGITMNVDCSDRALGRLDARLAKVHAATGRPVALVGHSRGAHFAKALAHWRPKRTSRVISIGAGLDTPFDISVPTKAATRGWPSGGASPTAAGAASPATTARRFPPTSPSPPSTRARTAWCGGRRAWCRTRRTSR
jgi:pimeloyl-ACP methyl ester carboxylesterase